MTIPSTARKAGPFIGTGVQTAWPFTFKVFADSDVLVTSATALGVETELVLDTDYSVAVNSNQDTSPGGTVTYPISGAPLPVGSVLVIVGDLAYDQPLDLPAGGNFSPSALENELDRLTMQLQQLKEQIGRALQVSVTTDASIALPAPASNQIIGWNVEGNALQNVPLSDLATAVAYGAARYDTFTGDGTITSFALAADPVAVGNLDVAVDGLSLTPGVDYSLVSGSLVFTLAPTNGAEILARYGEALPIGFVASGSVDASKLDPTFDATLARLGVAQAFTKAQRGTPVALTDAASVATDLALGNNFTLTLGGNRTLANPTNVVAGQSGSIVITQDATGSRTLAYGGYWKFAAGTAPSLTTTANAVDVLVYYVESATRITAKLVGDVK